MTSNGQIVVQNLSKRFVLPRLPRGTTLKEYVTKGRFVLDRESRVVHALTDVSFSVAPGQMLGVLGRNGSGKTTLLRLLAGIYAPDRGSVHVDGSITPLLALGAGYHPDLTGRENARIELLVLGVARRRLDALIAEIAEFSELGDFMDVPLRAYSSGMTVRLAFATATSLDLNVLLVDEALAVGDEAFAAKCLAKIDDYRKRGKAIVFVSHDGSTIRERCDVALWLERGTVASFGDPSEVVSAYEASFEARS